MLPIIKDNIEEFIQSWHERNSLFDRPEEAAVREILRNVRASGDQALFDYTQKFDGVKLDSLSLDCVKVENAYVSVADDLLVSLRLAIKNIADFHVHQVPQSWQKEGLGGIEFGWRYTPLKRVGIYVPGGTAAYPTSVLMNAIPARLAGVEEIVMVSPPDKHGKLHPLVLAAVREVGIKEVYTIGGAQAVGALAFGTKTIAAVDKIVGPGNIYVTLAKKIVSGICGIDKLAGPSDVVIAADASAVPAFVAADLLAQAEHDPQSAAIMVTDSEKLAQEVNQEMKRQFKQLARQDTIKKALTGQGAIILATDNKDIVRLTNLLAPEHLELMTSEPAELAAQITNAGAIFLGHYTPAVCGDYLSGPNHVLPTGGTARFDSPLSVYDFIKASSYAEFKKDTLAAYGQDIINLATAEGLPAHAAAIRIRLAP